ncbi:MAG: GNAT family N-acetyltransferase [Bacteroidales bacterium]|nr:GNAT family N-acetyltransferase [Bacteroidales bacterium]MBQ2492229.1 GNAT family N-acetyltransferase [Bacteroidales bacterium]
METVIQAIDRDLIKRELTPDKFIGQTRKGNNLIFEVTAEDSPFTMREIGRLREISFRLGGGGSGKSCDIDEFDTDPYDAYKQLIVWDKEDQEIIGGYRYIVCSALPPQKMATTEILTFSEKFQKEYLPWTIELGRSFIQPNYQSANLRRKSIFALDNLWDGLGALVAKYENIKYFFGKVTMYTGYNSRARNILLNFLHRYFPDPDHLVTANTPLDFNSNDPYIMSLFEGLEYKEALKVLQKELKANGENIPPLINSYMNLSPSMKVFDTAVNNFFGGVEETGILIKISDIYPEKIDRHVKPIKRWALDQKNKWWKRFKKRTSR